MVDAIVYRHKLNLKNNIEGYQWISEKFAKLLNLSATEVTAYKKELTLKNIKRTNAAILLHMTVPMVETGENRKRFLRICQMEGCGEKFYNVKNYEQHISYNIHRDPGGNYTCPICSKKIKRKIRVCEKRVILSSIISIRI